MAMRNIFVIGAVATVSGLEEDQCVCGRFRAVNAYGEAWSAPLAGRA